MKRLVGALAISLIFVLNLSTSAQTAQTPNVDSTKVEATVRNYIEAYYTGDAGRMQRTLHPHYLKHMIHGDIPMRERTGAQMLRDVTSGTSIPVADKTEQISVLDITGDIASAKLVTPHWVDYLTLAKSDGEWKILSVVQRIDN